MIIQQEPDLITAQRISCALAIRKGLSFAWYRLPAAKAPVLIIEKQPSKPYFHEQAEEGGFALAPFAGADIRFIQPDFILNTQSLAAFQQYAVSLAEVGIRWGEAPPATPRETYDHSFKAYKRAMEAGEVEKAILSRIIWFSQPNGWNPTALYTALEGVYPNAFVYLLYTPEWGMWCGASPEVLVRQEGRAWHTTALAGTRAAEAAEGRPWGKKEMEEHRFVVDYIGHILNQQDLEFSSKGPYTHQAGRVQHLKTDFELPAVTPGISIQTLAAALHPTPAVGGTPKKGASALIARAETHTRELYTGYLGPIGVDATTALFVNLRCARLFESGAALFVGGGITRNSQPDLEWEETNLKASTIMNVFENL